MKKWQKKKKLVEKLFAKFGKKMSRIAHMPIIVPENVNIKIDGAKVTITGPKGSLNMDLAEGVTFEIKDKVMTVAGNAEQIDNLLGMSRTMVANMVKGVVEGWSRNLELSGTGYRASVVGTDLQMALGFSHPVVIKAPEGIVFNVKENKITVSGADKGRVGELAAKIRGLRPADPYKAKGFKYEGEVIIRKAGKAAKAGAPAGK